MTRIVFGQLVPCRHCDGRGEVRHEKDHAAERERARLRRRGVTVQTPPSMDPCPVCSGKGFLPPDQADR